MSKSSVSFWTRDMPRVGRISYDEFRRRNAVGVSTFWAGESPRREARREAIAERAARQVGELSDREIVIAGAIAYWCEGPRTSRIGVEQQGGVRQQRSGLDQALPALPGDAGVTAERINCRVAIHESADVPGAQEFWRQVTALPGEPVPGADDEAAQSEDCTEEHRGRVSRLPSDPRA